jgi:hypothetical protein
MLLKGRGQRDTEHLCWGRGVPPGSFRLADALPRAWTTRAPASFWSHGTPGKAQTLGVCVTFCLRVSPSRESIDDQFWYENSG